MKVSLTLISGVVMALLLACGSNEKSAQAGATDSQPKPEAEKPAPAEPAANQASESNADKSVGAKFGSMLVETSKVLPTCDASLEGALAYVKSEETFYACSGKWEAVSIKGEKGDPGERGENGLGIKKIQIINGYFENLCTEYYLIENCYFLGGQVTRFADGTILVAADFQYSLVMSAIDFDSDTNSTNVTFVIPAKSKGFSARLSDMVARGDGFKSVFLVYSRELDKFVLVYDSNNNGEVDDQDDFLTELTLDDL